MLQLRNVNKSYGRGDAVVRALEDIHLDVTAGEVLMLMGPSGSGKTTLLSIMGCILKPTSGSIRVDGREVADLPERKLPTVRVKHFGFIFQGFNLFPALTARENVELAVKLKGFNRRQARREAEALLTSVGLAPKLNTLPADLSGGQKQRVAIARALAGSPPVLLADEPTAALDSETGIAVMRILADLARERGRSVVVVTHDTRLVEFADRIVHLRDGRVVNGTFPARQELSA
jgi:putative ABC transport system ATP-binding protein